MCLKIKAHNFKHVKIYCELTRNMYKNYALRRRPATLFSRRSCCVLQSQRKCIFANQVNLLSCNIKRSVENRRTLHSSGYFVLCTFGSENQMKSSKYWNSLVSFNDSLIFIHLAYLECVSILLLLLSLSSSCTIDIKWWECEKIKAKIT